MLLWPLWSIKPQQNRDPVGTAPIRTFRPIRALKPDVTTSFALCHRLDRPNPHLTHFYCGKNPQNLWFLYVIYPTPSIHL